ncbi:MAG: GHKL domain-containing protein [Lachnospiraceae bacterium]|nr:GHKL domain-containing protein [Lachnospiraceae bacterium]
MMRSDKKKIEELTDRILELEAANMDLKYELDSYKWQMEEINKQEEEIRRLHQNTRKLKHDMRNHLMVMASYLNSGDPDSAKDYISEILEKLNAVRSYVETGNPLLNHILNDKLRICTDEGIDVKVQIGRADFERMKGIDFSAVFANAMDNAIEHERKEERKEIVINVSEKKGYDVITVKNRISGSVLSENPDLISTKDDNEKHGLGVKQIKDIVASYEGMTDFYEEDDFFIVSIFIPA